MFKIIIFIFLYSFSSLAEINLTTNNTVLLKGQINQYSISKASEELIILDVRREVLNEDYPIYIVIDSEGGSLPEAINFTELVKSIRNVYTISLVAKSAAALIVQYIPTTRFITDNSIMLFHEERSSFPNFYTLDEIKSMTREDEIYINKIHKKVSSRLKITTKKYKKMIKPQWSLYSDNIIKSKAADVMETLKCSKELSLEKHVVSVYIQNKNYNFVYSKCPLLKKEIVIEEIK